MSKFTFGDQIEDSDEYYIPEIDDALREFKDRITVAAKAAIAECWNTTEERLASSAKRGVLKWLKDEVVVDARIEFEPVGSGDDIGNVIIALAVNGEGNEHAALKVDVGEAIANSLCDPEELKATFLRASEHMDGIIAAEKERQRLIAAKRARRSSHE